MLRRCYKRVVLIKGATVLSLLLLPGQQETLEALKVMPKDSEY